MPNALRRYWARTASWCARGAVRCRQRLCGGAHPRRRRSDSVVDKLGERGIVGPFAENAAGQGGMKDGI